jgi:hypothetical protein
MMRTRIKVNGLWYRPVPWTHKDDCRGCALEGVGCINTTENKSPCDDGNEFTGMVLIRDTKEAYEEYMHKAVLLKFDNANNDDD